MTTRPPGKQRRDPTAFEIVCDVTSVDKKFGRALDDLLFTELPRIRSAALRGGQLWLRQGHSGIIIPVTGASDEPRHIAWVDWIDETIQVLRRAADTAP